MFYKVRLHKSKEFTAYRVEIKDIMYISSMPNAPRLSDEMIIDILYTNIGHLVLWKLEVYKEYQRNKDHIHSPSQIFKTLDDFPIEVRKAHDNYLSQRDYKKIKNGIIKLDTRDHGHRRSRNRKASNFGKPSKSASVMISMRDNSNSNDPHSILLNNDAEVNITNEKNYLSNFEEPTPHSVAKGLHAIFPHFNMRDLDYSIKNGTIIANDKRVPRVKHQIQ